MDNAHRLAQQLWLKAPFIRTVEDMATAIRKFRIISEDHIGWFNSTSKRFCYLDEKKMQPEHFRFYQIPVFTRED